MPPRQYAHGYASSRHALLPADAMPPPATPPLRCLFFFFFAATLHAAMIIFECHMLPAQLRRLMYGRCSAPLLCYTPPDVSRHAMPLIRYGQDDYARAPGADTPCCHVGATDDITPILLRYADMRSARHIPSRAAARQLLF